MYGQRLAAMGLEQTSPAGRNDRMPKRKPFFLQNGTTKGMWLFFSANVSPNEPSQIVQRIQIGRNVQIEKPHVSDLYTKNMGGVDRADQL